MCSSKSVILNVLYVLGSKVSSLISEEKNIYTFQHGRFRPHGRTMGLTAQVCKTPTRRGTQGISNLQQSFLRNKCYCDLFAEL